MNEYDSNRILDITKKIGYQLTNNVEDTDCYVINTCHIREKATDKVYHDVGRVKKTFKDKKKPILLIVGCVAQAEGEIILKKEKYIDGIIGPQSYHKINELIINLEKKNMKKNFSDFEAGKKFDQLNFIKNSNSKISAFLTIQEGCDKFCKFCVVPYTRGPEYSRPFTEIISEANQLIENGAKEITLLGQNVNAYQFKNKKLSDLIYKLETIKGLERIRYTTSHPNDLTEDLIKAHCECKKLMPILHLPVQSGSSKILKMMNRKHTAEDYIKTIEKLVKKKPSIKFSSDFIISYPGESENDFKQTVDLMKKIKFINSYSFIFSPRPGTPAGNLKIIEESISKKRLNIFQNLADKIKKNYRKSLINSEVKVLFENKMKDEGKYFGRDEYLNSVIVESNEDLTGKIISVKIKEFNHNTLFGKISNQIKSCKYAA